MKIKISICEMSHGKKDKFIGFSWIMFLFYVFKNVRFCFEDERKKDNKNRD